MLFFHTFSFYFVKFTKETLSQRNLFVLNKKIKLLANNTIWWSTKIHYTKILENKKNTIEINVHSHLLFCFCSRQDCAEKITLDTQDCLGRFVNGCYFVGWQSLGNLFYIWSQMELLYLLLSLLLVCSYCIVCWVIQPSKKLYTFLWKKETQMFKISAAVWVYCVFIAHESAVKNNVVKFCNQETMAKKITLTIESLNHNKTKATKNLILSLLRSYDAKTWEFTWNKFERNGKV